MFGLLALIAFVVAIVAIQRTKRYYAQLAALERELESLRALVTGLARGRGAETEAPRATPSAPPMGPRTEAPPPPRAEEPPPPRRPEPPREPEQPRVPPPIAPPPSAAPARSFDWERFAGVRAAAVVGGVALALAGLLLFKYSIEHGLFPPWLRVVSGVVVGVGAIVVSEWRLRREYAATADAMAGGGIVVLYASVWAASVLYELIPTVAGFVLMVAVTATCCALSWRHASLVVALLGLIGGFATPLLLSTGSDRPLGLFGYVLLLDVALLLLARRHQWPGLAVLSLIGTLLYELLWIGSRMSAAEVGLGLGILGTFALVFALAGRLVSGASERDEWRLTQAGAVLVPFAFALYFATNLRLQASLHQIAALLLVLSAAAGWLARVQRQPTVALGAAAAGLAVVAGWVLVHPAGSLSPVVLWSFAIAAVFHVFVEREPDVADHRGPSPPAILAAVGYFVLLVLAAVRSEAVWVWVTGFAALAGLLVRHGGFPGREYLHRIAALGLAIGLTGIRMAHESAPWFPAPEVFVAVVLAAAVAFQVAALLPRTPAARREADLGAAILAIALLAMYVAPGRLAYEPVLLLGTSLALGILAALAGTRAGEGAWILAAVVVTALVQTVWTLGGHAGSSASPALAIQALTVVLFTAWPFFTAPRLRADRWAWPAAALAGPAWFLSLRHLYVTRFGDGTIGLLPIALGAVSLAAVVRARQVWAADDPRRITGLAWFSAVALGFATVTIPLQLEREWITIGWALEGVAVLALWTRLDHPGLKYFGVALLGAATLRLVANPAVLGYYPRPAWRIVNWLFYTYLVPAAAALAASSILAPRELTRARRWERQAVYAHGWPLGAYATGLAGLVLVFVWINLAIADWFATGTTLVVTFERLPARDLATSITWALYALLLLGIGMARHSIGLRWVSLGLLLVTITKVFVYDLGELRDLYRVASLLGLAVSLMLVSLAYQRFVFRDGPLKES